MSCSKTYWLLGGGWFQCRYEGLWTVSYYSKFHVVRSFLVFSGFGLKSPASGFQFYSSSSLKTSSTIQHSFRRQWLAFLGTWWPQLVTRSCFVKFALHPVILLMNLQEREWSPHPIPLPSWLLPSLATFRILSLNFCHFNYNRFWWRSLCIHLVWDPLFFLYLDICFLLQYQERNFQA